MKILYKKKQCCRIRIHTCASLTRVWHRAAQTHSGPHAKTTTTVIAGKKWQYSSTGRRAVENAERETRHGHSRETTTTMDHHRDNRKKTYDIISIYFFHNRNETSTDRPNERANARARQTKRLPRSHRTTTERRLPNPLCFVGARARSRSAAVAGDKRRARAAPPTRPTQLWNRLRAQTSGSCARENEKTRRRRKTAGRPGYVVVPSSRRHHRRRFPRRAQCRHAYDILRSIHTMRNVNGTSNSLHIHINVKRPRQI